MGYRLKFLIFLSVFLIGAFSIITWKAFRVYSESFAETAVQGEMEILEERVRNIAGEFERFKVLANAKGDIEAQMKAFQIPLMAHVVFTEGKWKAQWFEGMPGMREQAKSLASQIAFDSTPQSRNSWAAVRFVDRTGGYAFIIPTITDKSVHFFSFFMDQKSLAQVLKKSSVVESLHIVSPQAGEIFSTQAKDMRMIDGKLKNLAGKTQGVLVTKSAGNKVVLYQFHPFLQSYVFKVIPQTKVASLPLARFYGLIFFALILCGIAVYAMHILFVALFDRLSQAVQKIRVASGVEILPVHGKDELIEIEYIADAIELQGPKEPHTNSAEATVPAIVANTMSMLPTAGEMSDETTKAVRSRVINCLGYLNRIKAQFQIDSPHIRLLEQELRELRKMIDPQSESLAHAATPSVQPAFNPILSSFQKEMANEKTETSSAAKTTDVAKDLMSNIAPTVRRPKREINDFGDL